MKANKGVNAYYPEMGDKKPIAEIYARLTYGGKYRLVTPLQLKGRGIKFHDTYNENNCNNPFLYGWNIYYVTERAFNKLREQYAIAQEILLD